MRSRLTSRQDTPGSARRQRHCTIKSKRVAFLGNPGLLDRQPQIFDFFFRILEGLFHGHDVEPQPEAEIELSPADRRRLQNLTT